MKSITILLGSLAGIAGSSAEWPLINGSAPVPVEADSRSSVKEMYRQAAFLPENRPGTPDVV